MVETHFNAGGVSRIKFDERVKVRKKPRRIDLRESKRLEHMLLSACHVAISGAINCAGRGHVVRYGSRPDPIGVPDLDLAPL